MPVNNFSKQTYYTQLAVFGILLLLIVIPAVVFVFHHVLSWKLWVGILLLILLFELLRPNSKTKKFISKNTGSKFGKTVFRIIVIILVILTIYFLKGYFVAKGEYMGLQKAKQYQEEMLPTTSTVSYKAPVAEEEEWPEDMTYVDLELGDQTLRTGVPYRYKRNKGTRFYTTAIDLPATAELKVHKLGDEHVYITQKFDDYGSAYTVENHNDGSDGWKYITVDQNIRVRITGALNKPE